MLTNISVISWSFFKIFFTEYRSYEYLQDATLFVLLSDKNTEKLFGSPGTGFSIGSKTWYKTCAQLVFGQLLSDYSIKSLDILDIIRL